MYAGGRGVRAHCDDEPPIQQAAPLLTYSFGASARFVVRSGDEQVASLLAGHGTLVSMLGAGFLHAVPLLASIPGSRRNAFSSMECYTQLNG